MILPYLIALLGSSAAVGIPPVIIPANAGPELRADTFDILITGGRLYDGTENPWRYADVGIRRGRIAAVGRLAGATAARIIDATGRAVVPGFIDLHSHADGGLGSDDPRRRAAPNLVAQGITTVVVNQDGRSPWPISEQRETLTRAGIGLNAILMVGHGELRRQVMGPDFRRAATAAEIDAMRALLRQAVIEGAWGISAGLEYVPGRWSTTDEVVALVAELAPVDGVYISHERSEGSDPMWYWPSRDEAGPPTLLDAVRETITIGERTGVTVVASHIKAKGRHYWGSSAAAIELIERARERGVPVWADQYPYTTTGSDGNTVLIPSWVFERNSSPPADDYATQLERRLADPAVAQRIRGDIAHEITRRGGPDRVVIFEYPDTTLVGLSLDDLARRRNVSPVEIALMLQREGDRNRRGGARLRGFSLAERDVEAYAPRPWVATASDAGIALPEDGSVHARYYGTFPRKLRRYAMDRGVLSVEAAIRSATSLPAAILGLRDRGLIHPGYAADIAVLDFSRLRDRATFFEPHQYAAGVEAVLVNGVLVVDSGTLQWTHPGQTLTRTRP